MIKTAPDKQNYTLTQKRRDSHQILVHYKAMPSKLVNPDSQ